MSYASALSSHASAALSQTVPKVAHFTAYERQGVIIMSVAGVASCALVSCLLLYILLSAMFCNKNVQLGAPPPFITCQVAVFVICLLLSDLIQSFAGLTQIKWAMENMIYEGRACSVQGRWVSYAKALFNIYWITFTGLSAAALVMGDLASTVWSCVIAIHTFSGLALGKRWPRWVVFAVVFLGWALIFLLTIIPPYIAQSERGPFFSIAGTWCFISSEYAIQRLGVHYIPLFVAAVVILVFYGLLFLTLRGSISFGGRGVQSTSRKTEEVFSRERIAIAKRMLWYPAAYLTCIFPIAIIRLVGLHETNVPEAVWIFGMFFLFALGAVDSIIYATTRKLIKPINLPTHMRNISNSQDLGSNGLLSRNTSVYKSSPYSPSHDKTSFKLTDGSEEDILSTKVECNISQKAENRTSGICVTLETIKEVS